jgi:tetratricopeptide (TPR) repeat protein
MLRSQTIRKAQKAFEQKQYPQVMQLLAPLYAQQPQDAEVFYLLLDVYQALENLDAAEQLIRQFEKATGNAQHKLLLGIYLSRKDIQKALSASAALIAEYPDFYEEIGGLGFSFHASGYEQAFLQQLQNTQLPDYNPLLAIAHYHVMVKQDYAAGMDCIRQAMEQQPDNKELPYYLESYKKELIRQQKQAAQKQLSGETEGDAIAAYRNILELDPGNVTAQEYYLIAQTCKKFPPFYWYFYKTNFVSLSPYFFRAIFLLVYTVVCSLYYKGGKTAGATDHLQSVTLFFAALAIPRYTLLPISIQIMALWYVPGYHLLKKPLDFVKGLVMLAAWSNMIFLSLNPSVRGFDYFICGGFVITYIGLLELASTDLPRIQRIWLLCYTVVSGILSVLAYGGIVADGFLFFAFAGWMPPLFAGMTIDFYKKHQRTLLEGLGDEVQKRAKVRTQNIHAGALITSILLAVVFFASQKLSPEIQNYVGNTAFSGAALAITLFSFTESSASNRDFSSVWAQQKVFRRLFLLCGLGMMGGLLAIVPYTTVPLRTEWRWIPGVAVFAGSWVGLFLLYYRFLRKKEEY